MRLRNVAGLSQQQRHGVFGCRDDVALRGVDHHHAATSRCFHIDVVEADAGATDDQQLVGVLQHLRRHLRGRADDESLRAADVVQQGTEIELHVDGVAGSPEAVEASIGDFFGDKDPRHWDHRYRRNQGFEKN